VAPWAGAGYIGYNWLENRVGGTAAKLILGVSGVAIAYAAFRGISSAASYTKKLVKNAAKIAILGAAAFIGYSYLFNANATTAVASTGLKASALDIDNIFDVNQLRRSLTNKFQSVADGLKATLSPFTAAFTKISGTNIVPPTETYSVEKPTIPTIDIESPAFVEEGVADTPRVPSTEDSLAPRSQSTGLEAPTDVDTIPRVDTAPHTPRTKVSAADDTARVMVGVADANDEAAQAARDARRLLSSGGAEAVATELKGINAWFKSGRLAANLPVVGTAIGLSAGVGMAYFSSYASELQRIQVEKLLASGKIDQAACDAFKDMSTQNEAILLADVGVSTLDPTGASIVLTAGAEYATYSNFQDWLDQYAPDLDQTIAENLSMSLFTPNTIRSEIISDVMHRIPGNIEGQPVELHALIQAKQELVTFGIENPPPHIPMMAPYEITKDASERYAAWQEQATTYRNAVSAEVNKLVSTSKGFESTLSILSSGERLEIIERLYLSETRDRDLALNAAEQRFSDIMNTGYLLEMGADITHPDVQSTMQKYNLTQNFVDKISSGELVNIMSEEKDLFDNTKEKIDTAFSDRIENLSAHHPEVAEYIKRYDENGWFDLNFFTTNDSRSALKNNPKLMDHYIMERFGYTEVTPTPKPDVDPNPTDDTSLSGQFGISQTVRPNSPAANKETEPTHTATVTGAAYTVPHKAAARRFDT